MIFASGAPIGVLRSALAEPALATLDRAGAPVLFALCETLALVGMNQAAADLFGANFESVSQRLFRGTEPGARRLAVLAHNLLPDAAPRLERMRFFFGAAGETLTFLCRRIPADEGRSLLVLAVPGIRAGLLPASVAANESLQRPALHAVEPAREEPASLPAVGPVPADAAAGGPPANEAPAGVRLVWRTDRDQRLAEAIPPFGTLLRSPIHVTGRNFADVLRDAGVDPDRLIATLSSAETFSGLTLDWPTPDGRAATVEFGGMPMRDAQNRFAGFRGFALVHRPPALSADAASPADSVPLADSATGAAPLTADHVAAPPAGERPAVSNVVPLRPLPAARPPDPDTAPDAEPGPQPAATSETPPTPGLSPHERSAFDEIARALSGNFSPDRDEASFATEPSAHVSDDDGILRNIRAMVDLVPIGILVSRDGVPIFANRTLLDLTGYANVDELHDSGGLERLFGGANVGDANEDAVAVTVRTIEGDSVPVDARIHAISWDGLPATLVSLRSARDRTAAIRAKSLERSLRERDSEARDLHTILDTATDGVAILDADANILTLNRSAEALFGRDAGEVTGHAFGSLVADESRAALEDYLAALRGGGVASLLNDGREILCRGPREGHIPVFVTIGRLDSEESPKLFAVLRDLTAWKDAERGLDQARQDAERASAQKSEFLARISHEIRTPLNAILGFAEVIMDERFGPVGNDRYRDYMKDIHRSGEHVMSLVNDLLDLSKIEAGKMEMTFTAVDANSCVADCVSLMQPQASSSRVIMRLSLSQRLPKIIADERAFKQIVLNILSNAVKYNETGGQVIVSTARTDAGYAVVRIRDTGVGMSESDVQVALEPFGQIHTSRSTTGTGLGLPLTKALVEANRANFTIKSRKGEGTLVEVAFPPSRVMAD